MSSVSSSSTPEPSPPSVKSAGKKSKKSAKSPLKNVNEGASALRNARNEGVGEHWAYEPPEGAVLLDQHINAAEFDWDAINASEDFELCLIRIPDSVKPKSLEHINVDISNSIGSGSARVGAVVRKHATFDIWSIGDDDRVIGGEEIKRLTCLLPRKSKKGRLYPAPKPIARHLIISAQPARATMESSDNPRKMETLHQNPVRESHPKELLKHRFMPYGSLAPAKDDHIMDIDVQLSPMASGAVQMQHEPSTTAIKKPKGKKRKGEVVEMNQSGPKKSKKAKTTS